MTIEKSARVPDCTPGIFSSPYPSASTGATTSAGAAAAQRLILSTQETSSAAPAPTTGSSLSSKPDSREIVPLDNPRNVVTSSGQDTAVVASFNPIAGCCFPMLIVCYAECVYMFAHACSVN